MGQRFNRETLGYTSFFRAALKIGKAKIKRLALAAGQKTRKSSVLKKVPTMQVVFLKKRFYYDPKSKTIKSLTRLKATQEIFEKTSKNKLHKPSKSKPNEHTRTKHAPLRIYLIIRKNLYIHSSRGAEGIHHGFSLY